MKNRCVRVRLVIQEGKVTAHAQTRSARGTLAFRGKAVRLLENQDKKTVKAGLAAALQELLGS